MSSFKILKVLDSFFLIRQILDSCWWVFQKHHKKSVCFEGNDWNHLKNFNWSIQRLKEVPYYILCGMLADFCVVHLISSLIWSQKSSVCTNDQSLTNTTQTATGLLWQTNRILRFLTLPPKTTKEKTGKEKIILFGSL